MKAILEFNLPEENEEYKSATLGCYYQSVIRNLLEYIRSELKYKDPPPERAVILEEIRSFINNELDDINPNII